PYQRGILLLGLLFLAVHKLCEWLSTDALTFVFYFVGPEEDAPLAPEWELLRLLLKDQVENGTVELTAAPDLDEVARDCALRARRSLCQALVVSAKDPSFWADDTHVSQMWLDGACPVLAVEDDPPTCPDPEEPLESWNAVVQQLVQAWM